jgi:hypothetical protein
MKTRLNLLILLPGLIWTIASCNSAGKSGTSEGIDSISLEDLKPLVHDTLNDGLPIFYNMYLSVDMSTLFQSSGAVFKQELLNSPDKVTDYITSSEKALNLGIYAVDLTYAKVSEQLETAGLYFNAMQKLAEEMGIPADYFKNAAGRFDRNINNKDSLMKIANEIYMASDDYLRDNERYAASAQMIMGGWIEAIHIASDIAVSTKDIDIIERLAEQRISLGNVIGMLEDYAGDVVIMQNLQKLKMLQSLFDTFIVHVDSGFNPVSPEGKKIIQENVDKINQISRQINQIRSAIIS